MLRMSFTAQAIQQALLHPPPAATPLPCCSDLAGNALTGSLPAEWGTLSGLRSLDASSNYLTGPLPDSWHQLAALQQLQLASNNLGVSHRSTGRQAIMMHCACRRLCGQAVHRDALCLSPALPLPMTHPGSRPPATWPPPQGAIPPSWAQLPALRLLVLSSNVGLCGAPPRWGEAAAVHAEATSLGHSCVMVRTSGTFAAVVLGERRWLARCVLGLARLRSTLRAPSHPGASTPAPLLLPQASLWA